MRLFLQIFAQSWRQLFRNAWIWIATIVVILLAFVTVHALFAANILANQVLSEARQRVDVTFSFRAGTPPQVVEQARTYLSGLPAVDSVSLITADQALTAFRTRYRYQEDVQKALQEVGRNPLGAEVTVRAKSLDGYASIVEAMQVPAYQDWLNGQSSTDHARAIQELQALQRAIRIAGSLFLLLFAGIALLLVFNAVRTAIFSQREEIKVMRLVGATQMRIRLPYVLSVLWATVIAWAVVIGLAVLIFWWLLPQASGWLQLSLYSLREAFLQNRLALVAEFAVVAVLSMLVAWIVTGKYIKR